MLLALRKFTVVALMSFSSACVFTPVKSPERRSAQIGDSAQAIIRIRLTDRDTVLKKFGKPSYSTQNDLAFGYLFAAKTGTAKGLLMGPCIPYFGESEVWESDDVWLEFDERAILKRVEYRLIKKHDNDPEAAWRQFAKSVPDKIRPEQMLDARP